MYVCFLFWHYFSIFLWFFTSFANRQLKIRTYETFQKCLRFANSLIELLNRINCENPPLVPISTPESFSRYGTVWYVFFCFQNIFLVHVKKYFLRTKENVPNRTGCNFPEWILAFKRTDFLYSLNCFFVFFSFLSIRSIKYGTKLETTSHKLILQCKSGEIIFSSIFRHGQSCDSTCLDLWSYIIRRELSQSIFGYAIALV